MATQLTNPDDIEVFDFSVNLLQALLWQYNDATNLQSLLQSKSDWYNTNQKAFWQNWITNVFDLRTANRFGLEVWSIILDLPIFVNAPPRTTGALIGFDSQTGYNFNISNFGDNSGATYQLPLETARLALRLRYFQLVSSGTVPETNRMLKYLFGAQRVAYLLDYGNMTQRYIFNFPLTFDLLYLFNNYDILPRPAAVQSFIYDNTLQYFGFASNDLNFNNGNFGA